MNRDGDLPPGMDGGGEGQIGKGEEGAALDEADAVAVVILQRQNGRSPAAFRMEKFNPHKLGKEVAAEEGLQPLGSDVFAQMSPPCFMGRPPVASGRA